MVKPQFYVLTLMVRHTLHLHAHVAHVHSLIGHRQHPSKILLAPKLLRASYVLKKDVSIL